MELVGRFLIWTPEFNEKEKKLEKNPIFFRHKNTSFGDSVHCIGECYTILVFPIGASDF